jgi:uncharacterized membrane protein
MEDSATFCAACGTAVGQSTGTAAATAPAPAVSQPVAPVATSGGLEDNVAGMLAYLFVPAVIFLVMEPYNKKPFVRFHSFQCIFLLVVEIVLSIVLSIVAAIPIIGLIVVFLIGPIFGLACLILWVVLLMKAYQNQKFKLPFIGDLAEKQASA